MVTTPGGIPNNGFGYVARFGAVRGVNASGTPESETWAEGDKLYLSTTTPGALTNIPPVGGTTDIFSVLVGLVVNNSATVGVIGVDPRNPLAVNTLLGTSDRVAPSQNAVQKYVDSAFKGGALVYNTGAQSIASDLTLQNPEPILFGAETYDSENIHDNVTNNDRLTVPSGVTKVSLSGNILCGSGTGHQWRVVILKNGSVAVGLPDSKVASSSLLGLAVSSAVVEVTGGDYFTLAVKQSSGSAQNVSTTSWFAMEITGRS
jgi:hypothetical protein